MKVVKEEEEEEGDLCDGCEGGIYALRGRGGGYMEYAREG